MSETKNSLLDPSALMRIRSMELRAKLVVEGFLHGLHRSPYHGFSVEFSEYRQYAPGDDPRHIDWRVYARTDRIYIKKYEDETNLRVQFLVDGSKSMGYASADVRKSDYAATMAATMAYFLSGQGDAAGVTTFDEEIVDYLPPRSRPGHIRRLMTILEKQPQGTATDFGKPLERIAQMQHRRGMFVLFSDLLAPIEELGSRLRFLRARGHEVVIFQILDPRERDFEFKTATEYVDLETGQRMFLDPGSVRKDYISKLEAHLESIETMCAEAGIDYHLMTTDCRIETALQSFLNDRLAVGRAGGVAGGGGGARANPAAKGGTR